MSHRRRYQPARVHANLTPMIDVTFLLIIFFVLVAQLTNRQVVEEIELPSPEDAVSTVPTEEARLIINVVPDDARTGVATYRVGLRDYLPTEMGIAELTDELHRALQSQPLIEVDVRADQLAGYGAVYPAMQAASRAGISRVNLAVHQSTDRAVESSP